ncbi:MAG: YdbL family protein [Gammaproteobacteria bacterium]|nr:YdbL family protein [Gammaproteobacteria bacterium]
MKSTTITAIIALSSAACVTVNIYFPAAAAEQAADQIIQDIYGRPKKGDAPEKPPNESRGVDGDTSLGCRVLSFIVPRAFAAQLDIDISSPGIAKLRASMRKRHQALSPFYASGAVGMTATGLLDARDLAAVPLARRNALKQLVAEENRDRNALYQGIARENAHLEWESEIRATFAERWVTNAPRGWWYQDDGGGWKKK